MVGLSAIKTLLSGEVLETGKAILDKFIQDPSLKAEAELELKKLAADRESQVEETLRTNMKMTADVIESEMKSGDNFTRRARPMLVYWGMLLITIREVANMATERMLPVLPEQFWMAWGGVVSIWIVGRSAEKFTGGKKGGQSNNLIKAITG